MGGLDKWCGKITCVWLGKKKKTHRDLKEVFFNYNELCFVICLENGGKGHYKTSRGN